MRTFVSETPKSFSELANRDDKHKWEKVIKDEIESLLENETWGILPRPNNRNVIDSKWVFTIKDDSNGNPVKYKAILVARGFSQDIYRAIM